MNIGIIGYSKYNGHPYSFSALINGICKINYHYCQYKYIKKYLKNYSKQKVFSNIYVTNIWCSNIREAKKIAKFSQIKYVSKNYNEFIDKVDAVIICLDDIKKKTKISNFFINHNIPVFVDKPAAHTESQLKKYSSKIFSSSGLYFSKDRVKIENLCKKKNNFHIKCKIGRGWPNYSVHLIEPLINIILKNDLKICKKTAIANKYLKLTNNKKVIEFYVNKYKCPLIFNLSINNKNYIFKFNDTLKSFTRLLLDFVNKIKNKNLNTNRLKKVIHLIERGAK